MDRDEFEAIVDETLASLPQWVGDNLRNIEILILDEPDEYLDPDGDGLLGLYVGTPLPEREYDNAGELPDVIYLFRNPHLALDLPPDQLRSEIQTTLIHEIAHYFGIDDNHLHKIGWG